jgi:formamidase
LMTSIPKRKGYSQPSVTKLSVCARAKAIWDFEGIFCSSRHIPGVRFAGLIHPGILGCAPSHEVLAEWNKREADLISTTGLKRVVAQPPEPKSVHAGTASAELKEKVGKEGARTIPGRPEHGGNCDIKNLSRGSKVYLPVLVKGAKFSCGDLHFSREFYAMSLRQ